MKRIIGALILGCLFLSGAFAQSTWRGQAEVWKSADIPSDGYFAASNDFPKNTVVIVENYKTRKTIQVRIVAPLPSGSSAMLLVSVKAADALDMRPGESTLVGAQMDTSIDSFKSVARDDRPTNPDPDVNPIVRSRDDEDSGTETATVASKPQETPKPIETPAVRPEVAQKPNVSPKAPTDPSTLAAIDSSTKIDPSLRPQVAEATPAETPAPKQPVTEAVPALNGSDSTVAAGRRVFIPPRPTDSVTSDAESLPNPSAPTAAMADASTDGQAELPQVSPPSPQLAVADSENPSELPSSPDASALVTEEPSVPQVEKVTPIASVPKSETTDETLLNPSAPVPPVAETTENPRQLTLKEPSSSVEGVPTEKPTLEKPAVDKPIGQTPIAQKPVDVPSKAPLVKPEAPAAIAVLPAAAPVKNAGSYVSTPSPLKGPVLGSLNVLTKLEKGKPYVQIASFPDEKTLVKEMERVKSYVPLSVFFNPAEKSPYRLMVASVPNSQLGVLLMHFKSQGYKSAVVVKG